MKFYLCQTVEGPRYARTQADAKALDPRFELVNYETDQAALVDRFNELLATPATLTLGDTHTHDINDEPDTTESDEPEARPAPSAAKVVGRKHVDRTWDQIELEEFIFAIPPEESYRLGAIEKVIGARREELEAV